MTTLELESEKGMRLHDKLRKRLVSRLKMAEQDQQKQHKRWKEAEESILAYLPESAADSRRRIRRENGEPQYTTIQIPYTFAQVMAAHTYWTSVFLGRTPVHQVAGRHGEGEMQIQAVESLLDYQLVTGKNLGPYYLWFYDAAKYGHGTLGEFWDQEMVQFGTIEEVEDPLTGEMQKVQTTQRVRGYTGHRFYNISPYDFFKDPRVTMGNVQKGEFCAVRQRVMWSDVVRRKAQGLYTNVDKLRGRSSHHDRNASESPHSSQLERPFDNWAINEGNDLRHPAVVTVFEVYVELVAKEWELGPSDFPEKWVFTITEDHDVIIGAQPLGMMHGEFPVGILEPEIEAYGSYNRGIPEIQRPVQQTMDWLVNTHMYNVRSALNNQFIVDPTRIYMKDVEKGGPGFVFRLKPEGFGQDVRSMFMQVPVNDVTRTHMQDLQQMFGIGERVFGINDQILGMLTGSGRKTATEVRTSTGFGVNRLKTNSEYMSATGFAQHAQRIIKGSQQFYDVDLKLRIVGDLAQQAGAGFLNVTPDSIMGSYDFVAVDGNLPIDRFAQVTLWKELFQQIVTMPQIMMKYDLAKIFAWVAQLAGIKNINQFQVMPNDVLAQQAQAGNLIPFPGGGGQGLSPNMAGMPQLGRAPVQVPGGGV